MPSDSRDRYFQAELRQITRKLASLEGHYERLKDRMYKRASHLNQKIADLQSRLDDIEDNESVEMTPGISDLPFELIPSRNSTDAIADAVKENK